MTPKVINVFTDSELRLIKEAIERKLRTTGMAESDRITHATIIKTIDRILTRQKD